MIITTVVLSALFHLSLQTSPPKALDPEQTLYVYKRCFEDHLPWSSSRATYIKSWTVWILEPNDPITHCYVRCALSGLQLYDEKAKSFKSEGIPVQYEAFKTLNGVDAKEVNEYRQAVSSISAGGGSCLEVYNAYIPVHNKFKNVARRLYHGTIDGAAKVYAAMPQTKKRGESFFAFCAKKVWGEDKKKWRKFRSYSLTDSAELKQVVDCVFRGLRYMDESGLKVGEVVRDFNLINKSDLEPEVRSASEPWKALDPEQALYVYKRCYEDHLPSGPSRPTYLKSWNAWKLEPNDPVTQCYAKCVLIGLQLYDENEKAFKIKQKGESYFAYCAKKVWGEDKKKWRKFRSYSLTDSAELKQVVDCVFRGLRYMDESGLKVGEVVRDFNLINKSDLEPEVRSVLASCKGTTAYDYYSCLLNSPVKEDFKKAFDFHELRSADYAFLLRGKVYEGPEKVKEEMKRLNTTVHF
uniref:Uncharacterized protein n=1 Tax=Anopheles epiroticus TaxID=199890 RepID=A0A182PCQ0_9DIPT